MARIFHYCPSITRRDAIGYSLMALHRAMLRAGWPSYLVCDVGVVDKAPPSTMTVQQFTALKPTRDDLLIFHYSFLDGNGDALLALSCRRIVVYHNITPARFFRDFGQEHLANACDAGRACLPRMAGAFDAAVAVSAYNAAELTAAGFPRPHIIPVFYDAAGYAAGPSGAEAFLRRRLEGALTLVFVGRFVPNKRPDNLIRVTAALKRMARRPVRLRLRLHGKVWDEGYFRTLRRLSEDEGVEHEVDFAVDQPQAALRASLASADAFVSMSEHEGFMVPLVEAFSAGCPVVALRATAVGETCGPAGLLVDEADPELVAAHVIALTRDRDLRRSLVRGQSARAEDFAARRTLAKWSALLRDFLPQPLVPHAHRV